MSDTRADQTSSGEPSPASPKALSQAVLELDGTGYISLNKGMPSIKSAVTVEFWARGQSPKRGLATVIEARDGRERIVFTIKLPGHSRVHWQAGVEGRLQASANLLAGDYKESFRHWAFVADGEHRRALIYRDGELIQAGEGQGQGLLGDIESICIGAALSGDERWRGLITELRIWHLARSPQDIRAGRSHRLSGQEAGLAGYWPLDEGRGRRAYDQSPRENHGDIAGGTWRERELELAPAELATTGLQDVAYWMRWKNAQSRRTDRPARKAFRRGRIWT